MVVSHATTQRLGRKQATSGCVTHKQPVGVSQVTNQWCITHTQPVGVSQATNQWCVTHKQPVGVSQGSNQWVCRMQPTSDVLHISTQWVCCMQLTSECVTCKHQRVCCMQPTSGCVTTVLLTVFFYFLHAFQLGQIQTRCPSQSFFLPICFLCSIPRPSCFLYFFTTICHLWYSLDLVRRGNSHRGIPEGSTVG